MKFAHILNEIEKARKEKNFIDIIAPNYEESYQYALTKLNIDFVDMLYGDMQGVYFSTDEGVAWIPYYLPIPYYEASLDLDKATIVDSTMFGVNAMAQLIEPLQDLINIQNKYLSMLFKIKKI